MTHINGHDNEAIAKAIGGGCLTAREVVERLGLEVTPGQIVKTGHQCALHPSVIITDLRGSSHLIRYYAMRQKRKKRK